MDAAKHCREHGSIFDVSHMCGLTLKVGLVSIGWSADLPRVMVWWDSQVALYPGIPIVITPCREKMPFHSWRNWWLVMWRASRMGQDH